MKAYGNGHTRCRRTVFRRAGPVGHRYRAEGAGVQMITVQRGFQATSKVLTSLNRIKTSFVNARIR